MILIAYCDTYKEGGSQFRQVAETLSHDLSAVRVVKVNSKTELKQLFVEIGLINEFHFVGHGGIYGPMFGTVDKPEQLSKKELKELPVSFSKDAHAYFHCCRSARWVAPYFANCHNVVVHGYHWYTSFTRNPNFYRFTKKRTGGSLYLKGVKGYKSHGIIGSIIKYSGTSKTEILKTFFPSNGGSGSYDAVIEEYANVFETINVREDEIKWLDTRIPRSAHMLDIGCGNGALLKHFSPRINQGVGVDISSGFIEKAKITTSAIKNVSFTTIDSSSLPFANGSFDLVISLLSFRYLDWDEIIAEIDRVLVPGGRFLIVDMVSNHLCLLELPKFFFDKFRLRLQLWSNKAYSIKLKKMVNSEAWRVMLKYNPIRSQSEMQDYIKGKYPNAKFNILNIGFHSRVLAVEVEKPIP